MNYVKTRCLSLALAVVTASPMMLLAQKSAPAVGQDSMQFTYSSKGKMSTYRNLAQLAYEFYLKGDNQRAAVLAGIIESVYDRSETDLEKNSPALHGKIDMAMDAFIKPLKYYVKAGRADPAKEQVAFENYLKCLALAD